VPRGIAEIVLASVIPSDIAVATRVGVAPGIVVGRMQKEGLIDWSHLNDLKVRYEWNEPQQEAGAGTRPERREARRWLREGGRLRVLATRTKT
jgi:hypothetical protein